MQEIGFNEGVGLETMVYLTTGYNLRWYFLGAEIIFNDVHQFDIK